MPDDITKCASFIDHADLKFQYQTVLDFYEKLTVTWRVFEELYITQSIKRIFSSENWLLHAVFYKVVAK
jgi:hypothetical protein